MASPRFGRDAYEDERSPGEEVSSSHDSSDDKSEATLKTSAKNQRLPSDLATASQGASTLDPRNTSIARLQYILEITQAPLRGRTCGYGDRDRRPLTPPLIVRLRVVDTHTGKEIDPGSVDITFLVCAADLWSGDRLRDMNLVQHPTFPQALSHSEQPQMQYSPARDAEVAQQPWQFPPAQGPSTSRLTMDRQYGGRPATGNANDQMPILPLPSPFSHGRRLSPRPVAEDPFQMDAAHPPAYTETSPRGSSRLPLPPYPSYPPPPPARALPSESMMRQQSTSSAAAGPSQPGQQYGSPAVSNFAFHPPGWYGSTSLGVGTYGGGSDGGGMSYVEAAALQRRRSSHTSMSTMPPRTGSSSGPPPTTGQTSRPGTSLSVYDTIPPNQPTQPEREVACVKNLVGALSTSAYRLTHPEETSSGIFFVFHDLSVRTEGAFSLRLRLVSVGSLERTLLTSSSQVMAEAFSDPFEVASAKRFAGMMDPTSLSQAFAKQGLRIPTRKGANRKRRKVDATSARRQNLMHGSAEEMDPEEDHSDSA